MRKYLLAAVAGAALAFFLDPENGESRRRLAGTRLGAAAEEMADRLEDAIMYSSARARGFSKRMLYINSDDGPPLNDPTLASKVKTELFRHRDVPKGKIKVNAEEGVVVLRGEVQHPDAIVEIEDRVRDISGVQDVANLLHLPSAPPPQL